MCVVNCVLCISVELDSLFGLLAGWKKRHLVLYQDSSLSWFTDSTKTKVKGRLEIEVSPIHCHYSLFPRDKSLLIETFLDYRAYLQL